MDYPKCPHCGVSMRLELNRTLVAHPSEAGCQLDGYTFNVSGPTKGKRGAWDVYCAKQGAVKVADPTTAPLPASLVQGTPVVESFPDPAAPPSTPNALAPAMPPVTNVGAGPMAPPAPAAAIPGVPVAPPVKPA